MIDYKELERYELAAIRKRSEQLRIMYFGAGTDGLLSKINTYENEAQHTLRKKHRITNTYVTEELLRPADNIWGAKGGSTYLGVKDEARKEFMQNLQNVRPGVSLKAFMKDIWWQRFITDPNGLIFLEIKDEVIKVEPGKKPSKEPLTEKVPLLTFKSTDQIKAYEVSGTNVKWVLFEPHCKDASGNELSWYVDDLAYWLVRVEHGKFVIVDEVVNSFGFVPAILNSSIYSTETNHFVSPLEIQLDLLRSFLTKNSIKEIYQFLHLYPVFWQIEPLCPSCHGLRMVNDKVCAVCNGSGFAVSKDVSDVIVVKRVDEELAAQTPPAGYVQPDLETMEAQRTELGWLFEEMFTSHWGTTIEKGSNETATGRFIDIQPVNNKLDIYAGVAEQIEGKIIDLFGHYYYPETYKPSIVTYGRRFIIESPDIILKRYQEARDNSPTKVLDMLLEQFYYSEYQNDQEMIEYYLKLMQVEPYVHRTIEEVLSLPIADETKAAKAQFPQWQKEIKVAEVVTQTIESLYKSLIKFTQDEKIEKV